MADFVDKIVKDPKNPPATVMLTGYLGASSEPDHTRLYFDQHLSSYVDIPNQAILHQQDAKSDDGLQASHVWIARNAQLIHGAPAADRPKGTFLEGQIMQDHMAGAAGGAGGLQITHAPLFCPITVSPVQCPPHTLVVAQCPPITRPPQCPPHTLQIACPTSPVICNLRTVQAGCVHPTLPIICHPQTLPPQCLPRTVADPGCLASANVVCPTFGACPSIACGDPGQQVETPQLAAGAAAPQAQAAIATITPLGQVCVTHTPGCGGGGLHTAAQAAYATITPLGHICPTLLPVCGGGHNTVAQLSFPTITFQGLVCHTFNCGGGGEHTMAQFMPTNAGYCTWYMCPPAGGK